MRILHLFNLSPSPIYSIIPAVNRVSFRYCLNSFSASSSAFLYLFSNMILFASCIFLSRSVLIFMCWLILFDLICIDHSSFFNQSQRVLFDTPVIFLISLYDFPVLLNEKIFSLSCLILPLVYHRSSLYYI